jgi:hypothetical protein
MSVLQAIRPGDRVADLKLSILQQQELAGKLFRSGQLHQARQARHKLIAMLNQLDHIQDDPYYNRTGYTSSMERKTA